MEAETGAAEERIRVEQLKLALRNIIHSAAPPPFVVILTTLTLYHDGDPPALLIWGAVTILSGLLHTYLAWRRLAAGIEAARSRSVQAGLIATTTALAASWAAWPWVALVAHDTVNEVVIITVLTGVAAYSVATLAAVYPAVVAFVVVELGGLIGKLISLDEGGFPIMGVFAALYLLGLLGIARSGAGAARAGIMLRFENLALVERLEEEKRHAERAHREAERANRAKSRFLAAASHDLRQPIHAQGLFMDVLGNSGLTPAQGELLDHLRGAWQASLEMLDTLLDFSRIEAGTVLVQPHPFPLQPLLAKLEREFGPQADHEGLVYRSRDSALAVDSDPVLVELILRNLLANAIRYSRRGGVLIGCRRRGGRAVIEVWDTGIGIAREQHEEIFQAFSQIGNRERDRRNGLGLGLAIVRGLAEALGAPLSLASRSGRGSVFRLAVPLARAERIEPVAGVEAPERRALGLRVLIIDDDETIRTGMVKLLASWGCRCRAVEAAAPARQAAEILRPELVISDLRLPAGQSGFQAIAAVRAALGRPRLPALLVTGDTSPERLREAAANEIPLVHKPILAEQLYRHIMALLDGGGGNDPAPPSPPASAYARKSEAT
ncbi:ATP-binding response regulator [Endothiovibrio diazotrophicus]